MTVLRGFLCRSCDFGTFLIRLMFTAPLCLTLNTSNMLCYNYHNGNISYQSGGRYDARWRWLVLWNPYNQFNFVFSFSIIFSITRVISAHISTLELYPSILSSKLEGSGELSKWDNHSYNPDSNPSYLHY